MRAQVVVVGIVACYNSGAGRADSFENTPALFAATASVAAAWTFPVGCMTAYSIFAAAAAISLTPTSRLRPPIHAGYLPICFVNLEKTFSHLYYFCLFHPSDVFF